MAVIDAKQARPVDDEAALVPFGWAPGGYYCAACSDCGLSHSGSDKRSVRCQDCAEALRDKPAHQPPMTAVDHAELGSDLGYWEMEAGRLHEGRKLASEFSEVEWGFLKRALTQSLALLSEIEGLKAERDRLSGMLAEVDEGLSEIMPLIRTQAPDSWRPDREAVMAIIDANKYEPWTVDRAGQMADAILAVRPQDEAMTAAFVPIDGQCFTSEQDWINRATRVLTGHAQYNNTEHGDASGWRGPHFTALSFDQAGRRVRNGADFKRATVEGTYPVWWIWPDQIVPALRPQTAESGE